MSILYRVTNVTLLACVLFVADIAYAAPVSLADQTDEVDLASHLEVLEDPSRQLGITQVSSPVYAEQFQSDTRKTGYFGYSAANWWLRFELNSLSHDSWYLLVDQPVDGEIELFVLPQHGSVQGSINLPLFKRLPEYRTPAWKLNLPREGNFTVYLRANNGQAILRLPLRLMTNETFITHGNQQYMFFTLVFSGLLVLAIYNLFLFFSLRERSYLALALFIALMDVIFYRDGNLFPALAFLNNPYAWFHPACLFLTMVVAFHYWRTINQEENRQLEILLKGLQWGLTAMLPLLGLIPDATRLAYVLGWLLVPVLTVMVTQTALRGHRLTRSAYLAAIGILFSVAIYILPHTGWFGGAANNEYTGQAAFLFAILLLSINQADRSRLLREQVESERAAHQAKDEFLTTMSHELRTPLNVVTGIGELLKQTPLSPQQQDYLGKQEKAACHLLQLMDELLDLSRIQGKLIKLEPKHFQLHGLVLELEQMFSVSAELKGLVLRVQTEPCPQVVLWGDTKHLKQVLINLLGNAIKYTEKGQVSLTVNPVGVMPGSNLRLRFEVADTGVGIPVEQQPRVFEPFYQVSSSRTRQYGGSGLGLAISHKLVQQMGGALVLESMPGVGTRFFFTLCFPVQQVDLSASSPAPGNNAPGKDALRGIRILLVDDDEVNRFVGKKLLAARGAEVVLAESGQQALAQVGAASVDLVLMDVSMPDMDGYETSRRIRADARFRTLPIIALTAHAIVGERERCLAAGMNDLVTKPFTLDALTKTITATRVG